MSSARSFLMTWAALALACGDDAPAEDETSGAATTTVSTSSVSTSGGPSTVTDTPDSSGPGSTGVADESSSAGAGTSDDSTGAPVGVLEIYWIDTEGGAATLMVTPDGTIVLVDAGFPGDRDADRIAAIVQDELGADAIDLCIVTHYHLDHVGGVPDLVERVPIEAFWDHGDSVEAGGGQGLELWQDYLAVADGKRTTMVPGEVHDVGGLELTIVAAARDVLDAPLPGAGANNPACDGAGQMGPDTTENASSLGFVARFGEFTFLDLGDLTWSYEHELACRLQKIGQVDLYQTTHHGMDISGAPQLVHALDPRVVVMNNGARKGGASISFERLAGIPSMPELWQQHRALDNDDAHNAPEERIANLVDGDGDLGYAIHARIDAAGTITMTNLRNGHTTDYPPG
ncbi:MAG: MBL fold metallo-hydrolase [Deltaproteobacteria bacterium]|nr:MBL fold metallo-hydrolase [Nannocystaceae bacterium]